MPDENRDPASRKGKSAQRTTAANPLHRSSMPGHQALNLQKVAKTFNLDKVMCRAKLNSLNGAVRPDSRYGLTKSDNELTESNVE